MCRSSFKVGMISDAYMINMVLRWCPEMQPVSSGSYSFFGHATLAGSERKLVSRAGIWVLIVAEPASKFRIGIPITLVNNVMSSKPLSCK